MAESIGQITGSIGQMALYIGHFAEFIGIRTQFKCRLVLAGARFLQGTLSRGSPPPP
ncbi:hypothetical protein [Sporosarcina koreensis]|uniref:hypothetical protein n=1 Tax=Sporosarcina koreensis TaxID=334735 RepID=UPI0015CF3E6F|nr:hypothetical protein [Sporosarcina koreensis]